MRKQSDKKMCEKNFTSDQNTNGLKIIGVKIPAAAAAAAAQSKARRARATAAAAGGTTANTTVVELAKFLKSYFCY